MTRVIHAKLILALSAGNFLIISPA